jgi:type IV pilus assembly protein PilC
MTTFSYLAKNTTGQAVRDTLEAESRFAALAELKRMGLTVVQLNGPNDKAGDPGDVAAPPRAKKDISRFRLSRHVPMADISQFCRLLATSVGAGLPLRDAVETIAGDIDNPTLRRALDDVVDKLHSGMPFSEALAQHPHTFTGVFVSLIRSAEHAGSMAPTLDHLASYLERTERLRREIRGLMAYPMFVVFFFITICVIMTLFVVPRFQSVFDNFDAKLPRLTIVVFAVNQFILENALWFLLGIGLLLCLFTAYAHSKRGAMRLDAIKLKLPLVGEMFRKYSIARVSRNLAIMLRGGISVTSALEMTSGVAGNLVLSDALLKARERILTGSDIGGSLRRDENFPRLFVRMVTVGEGSGTLPDVVNKLAEVYEEQVESQIKMVTSLLEPIVICSFGAIILLLVLAIYMPIFTVAQQM